MKIDLHVPTKVEAYKFGRRQVKIKLLIDDTAEGLTSPAVIAFAALRYETTQLAAVWLGNDSLYKRLSESRIM